MTKERKRRSEWGKGWDGRSRVPDDKYKKNYDEIDWSSVKKDKIKVLTPEEYEIILLEKERK
jgi:hypothetical protein